MPVYPALNRCDAVLRRAHAFVEEATVGYRDMESVLEPAMVRELSRIYTAAEAESV